ncbi:hypothetical protein BLS_002125 [Venturia inaequalis]|uniref:Uncharacterized protein n=1 Tax=Venturia inaequalis TaxID=5025 RepID=A0A8H3Z0H1_VENIN|nr:hypothetical protein EG328_009976 [Venturia inaequalis]KAE9976317.1 hypothetical protein BLS_002125 [Venturia inaequalis]
MTPLPLYLTVPAVTGLFHYLDARFRIRSDLSLLSNFIRSTVRGNSLEKQDKLSAFYKFEEWAKSKSHANKILLHYGGKSWTYAEAYQHVLQYGTWMKTTFGIQKGEIVALDCMNSEMFIWIWLGLWSIGAKPAFINYNLTDRSLLHSVKTSTARVVLVDERVKGKYTEELLNQFADANFREGKGFCEVVFMDGVLRKGIDEIQPMRFPDSDRGGQLLKDMAILIYTSGTTGLPKPAVCMPLYHSSAALLAFGPVLQAGSTLSLGEKFHRAGFWEDCRATNATIVQYVGETCRYLLSSPPSPKDKQHNVRTAFGNGQRPDVWPKFKERFGIDTIVEFYAATEGPGLLFNRSCNSFAEGAVGLSGLLTSLISGPRQKILKLDFETSSPLRDPKTGLCIIAGVNEPGELVNKLDEKDIDAQFQGYYGNKKATSSKVLRDVVYKGDAYFSTGDVMRRDEEGRWFFCDRIGDTFRWKSENVSTAEVAEVLGRISHISEANVYGVEIPGHDGRAGCAALTLENEQAAVSEAMLSEVAAQAMKGLPKYAVPLFLRVQKSEQTAKDRTGTNKQQKVSLRNEGVDPSKVADDLYWLPPHEKVYRKFGVDEWRMLGAGQVKL